ncbi:MAG: DUF1684 domain-containing protein [Thermonemataceae bacterium]
MKPQHIFFLGITATVVIIFFYALTDKKTEQNYSENLLKAREEREKEMKLSDQSPIENLEEFEGLSYYKPDPNFRLKATVEKTTSKQLYTINRTDSSTVKFTAYAYLSFKWNNETYKLLAFNTAEDPNTLFIPFTDATNGQGTYEGGRYLNLEKKEETEMVVDFNLAFNPSCVYNINYVCPIPPRENHLDFAVKAGEKLPIGEN